MKIRKDFTRFVSCVIKYNLCFRENEEHESKELETEFVSWPMVRYKREVLFGWIDLLGKVIRFF